MTPMRFGADQEEEWVELRVSWFKTSFIGESRHRS
jgi:hypothetical protein